MTPLRHRFHPFLFAALAGLSGGAMAEEPATFPIVIKDGRISPNRLEVPAGRKIKLTLKNEGSGPAEFENLDLRVEKILGPGGSSFVVIHSLKAGTHRFVDEFHPNTSELLIIAK